MTKKEFINKWADFERSCRACSHVQECILKPKNGYCSTYETNKQVKDLMLAELEILLLQAQLDFAKEIK